MNLRIIQGFLIAVIILGIGYLVYSFMTPTAEDNPALLQENNIEIPNGWIKHTVNSVGLSFYYPSDWNLTLRNDETQIVVLSNDFTSSIEGRKIDRGLALNTNIDETELNTVSQVNKADCEINIIEDGLRIDTCTSDENYYGVNIFRISNNQLYAFYIKGHIDESISVNDFAAKFSANIMIEENSVEIPDGWVEYISEDFRFEYPASWGELTLEEDDGNQLRFRASNDNLIKTVVYHLESKQLLFIEIGDEYKATTPIETANWETIKIIHENREIKTLYKSPKNFRIRTERKGVGKVIFSPNGGYINFGLSGYESGFPKLIDTNSGVEILKLNSERLGYMGEFVATGIHWLDGDKLMLAENHADHFGGGGRNEILISDYGDITTLNSMRVPCDVENYPSSYSIDNIKLKDGKVMFSIIVGCGWLSESYKEENYEYSYAYSIETKEFSKLP